MKKAKQILAIVAVILLVLIAVMALVFGLLTYLGVGDFSSAATACIYSMIIVPILAYVMIWLARMLEGRGNKEE